MSWSKSDSIAKLTEALVVAQALQDRDAESLAILPLARNWKGRPVNRKADSLLTAFLARVVYGVCDCWYWVGTRSEIGYGMFQGARKNYGSPEVTAHRIAWHLFNGPVPAGLKVLHHCDVRACVNPDHLFLGTQADNVRDMCEKGRQRTVPRFGEDNPVSRLKTGQVLSMREDYATGLFSFKTLAAKYGVSTMTCHRAVRSVSWSHL